MTAVPVDVPPPPVAAMVQQVAGTPAHLRQINWTPSRSARMPLVAVLDTGVNPEANGLTGVVDTARARSFVPGLDPLEDREGHGTHVASTIATVAGPGAAGRPGVRILPVTIADAGGGTSTASMVRGIRYAIARRAKVINISFGGTGFSRQEQAAINAASRAGALVVVSAGNSGERGGAVEYPGAYRQVLAVGAVGIQGRVLSLSARGPQVALVAPGEQIPAAGTTANEVRRTGTSQAAAVVSGAAVRIWQRRPGLTAPQVRAVLEDTARDLPPSGIDPASGLGLIDLRAALAAKRPPAEDTEPNDDTVLARSTPALLAETGPRRATARGRTGSWGDPRDGHRLWLAKGDRLTAQLAGPADADFDLVLWRPRTPAGDRLKPAFARVWAAAASLGPTSRETLTYTAASTGEYTLEVQGGRRPARYTLRVVRAAR